VIGVGDWRDHKKNFAFVSCEVRTRRENGKQKKKIQEDEGYKLVNEKHFHCLSSPRKKR
jgi:hypothetical protein